ncbi:unnamed protein product [Timema podura]|uniref:Uncharacterized protein n=1 Tax=Timema podura TaxID=61482 RepID=A0ABN7NUS6_TIMPD|nr:unnamed protein product [Timema podura]
MPKDLDVRADLYDTVPQARQELARVDGYSTALAAIEHIKSGILLGPSAPEAQFAYECQQFNDGQEMLRDNSIKRENSDSKSSCIDYFFEQVKLGNIKEVEKILDNRPNLISSKSGEIKTDSVFMKKKEELVTNLCHPLCSCDICEGVFSKSLCDTTPTVHSCDDRGFTALHVASLFGRPIIVDFLINCGSNVNASDYSGSTPLHYAAAKGHQNALLLLIHSEAKLDLPDSDGNTPLHLSANNGHEGCVKALLYFAEHLGMRLNTNVANSHGDMPLHHAARWGYSGIVQILLEHGASPTIENKRKLTPMDFAHSLHVSKLLLNAMKTNQVPINQLSLNSSHQNVEIKHMNKNLEIAAASKLPLDFSDNTNKDGLSTSSSSSSVKECLGVHPRSTDQIKKVDKLLRAISFGDTRLACYYLGLDGPNSSWNGDGKITYSSDIKSLCHPLCMCEKCIPNTEDKDESDGEIETGNAGNNSVLNVNVCNPEGFTPLHVATMHGRTEMVRLLLDANAHPNVTTRTKGATPLHLACQNQRSQVVRLLLQSGNCDIDLVDTRGNTALHYCCFTGNARLVELVLKFGPRLNIKNMDGKSPVEEAEEKMYLTIVRLLKGDNLKCWKKVIESEIPRLFFVCVCTALLFCSSCVVGFARSRWAQRLGLRPCQDTLTTISRVLSPPKPRSNVMTYRAPSLGRDTLFNTAGVNWCRREPSPRVIWAHDEEFSDLDEINPDSGVK